MALTRQTLRAAAREAYTAAKAVLTGKAKATESTFRAVSQSTLKSSTVSPSFKARIDWDPASRRAAIWSADSGNMSLAADLIDAMFADDRVVGCYGTRSRGLFGLPLNFEEGSGRKKRRAKKEIEASEDFWEMFPESELGKFLRWSVVLGIGVAEVVWTRAPGPKGRLIGKCVVKHPRDLRFDWPTRKWFLRVEGGSEVEITPGNGKWIVCTPYGSERPWAEGLWRALSLCWLAKHYDIRDWSNYNERHGLPMLIGESPEGAGEPQWREFGDDLASLGGRTTMATPPGYKVVIAEAKSQNWQTFAEQIRWADTAIAILFLGQNLTTEVSGGSLAAAEVHKQVQGAILRCDAETLSTCLRLQLLTWWTDFNFDDADAAPWPAWDVLPPEDKAKLAATWKSAAEAIKALSEALKEAFDAEEACDRLGLPLVAGVNPNDVLAAARASAEALLAQADPNVQPGEETPQKGAQEPSADDPEPDDEGPGGA
jgi:phage gp29-like protein